MAHTHTMKNYQRNEIVNKLFYYNDADDDNDAATIIITIIQ